MKILYLHRTHGRGAEGVHISSIVREWRRMGHSVSILSPPGVDPMAMAGEKPVDKSEFRTTGMDSVWKFVSNRLPQWLFEILEIVYNLFSLPALWISIRKNRPAFIYERYAFFHFAGGLISRLTGVPLILEVNEVSGIKRARRQIFLRFCECFEKRVFERAAIIFTVSSFLKNRILERSGGEKVVVMPNAVDAAVLNRKTRREEIRKKHGLGSSVVLGFAGWFDEWDRLDLLIEAYGVLRDRHDMAVLLIGDGKIRSSLEEHVLSLGGNARVYFTGPVARAEIFDYLDAVDIPVFPHSNDFGSPVVLFEFMSLGKPVVAPGLPPMRDVLQDGNNGLLFPPLDKEKLQEAMKRLIEDGNLRRILGETARSCVASRHTWAANAAGILRTIEGRG